MFTFRRHRYLLGVIGAIGIFLVVTLCFIDWLFGGDFQAGGGFNVGGPASASLCSFRYCAFFFSLTLCVYYLFVASRDWSPRLFSIGIGAHSVFFVALIISIAAGESATDAIFLLIGPVLWVTYAKRIKRSNDAA
jgi:hypothetical protein